MSEYHWEVSVESCLGEQAEVEVVAEDEEKAKRKAREKTEAEYGFENPHVYNTVSRDEQ